MAEQLTRNEQVAGSNPAGGSILFNTRRCSSVAERTLGKGEVVGSIPTFGSNFLPSPVLVELALEDASSEDADQATDRPAGQTVEFSQPTNLNTTKGEPHG